MVSIDRPNSSKGKKEKLLLLAREDIRENRAHARHVTTHRFTSQEVRGNRSQRSQAETQMGAASYKTSATNLLFLPVRPRGDVIPGGYILCHRTQRVPQHNPQQQTTPY